MAAITITQEIEIDHPAAEVWAVVADYALDPRWRHGIVTMAPDPAGPVQVGTTTAEELRFAGQTRHTLGAVTGVDPGRSFSWRTHEGTDAEGRRTVEALPGDRSRVRLELTVRPHGLDRVLAPVLGPMLRRTVRGDARRLRSLVAEAGATVDCGAATRARPSPGDESRPPTSA